MKRALRLVTTVLLTATILYPADSMAQRKPVERTHNYFRKLKSAEFWYRDKGFMNGKADLSSV